VLDIVNKVIEKMDSYMEPVVLGQATNEIRHQYLSAEKARKVLEWKPQYTLDEGLTKTIVWYRKFFAPSDMGWGSR
jgi:CDP-glucose 4,6-dehydratase